ncbi:D-alanyl-D-alanine carboxypeptidase family protein [Paenibacillus sp. MMS20-IR301]|uniref:M15 family metallopeptidase n=1 Tax=Paenibacillus sp. MMS20-IR301 TaxID=2895946 RepID=UPI0028E4B9E2|nr:D-alanyl-D-alanine carboxypeptidase family protein [Paenibacillus sp. MMS20-IR301]WNS42575.1 D-alanyl-D-alanine carboxypeptidase family protein [Paenibacillus sp. MMS20-IR301]
MSRTAKIIVLFIVVIAVGWGIGKYTAPSASPEDGTNINTGTELAGEPGAAAEPTAVPSADPDGQEQNTGNNAGAEPAPEVTAAPAETPAPTKKPAATDKPAPTKKPATGSSGNNNAEMTAAEPESITVMVNKQYKLPDNYKPADLVYPDVPFIFSEKIEKRMMRREAAKALEEMFAGAKKDGVYLAGVSGYRSESTQKRLFNNYVARDGEEKARTYSAVPGHSEHQTGLAIDLSGSDGKCAAESCFAGTKEANWLAEHAAEYGYIIRFLEGKQAITGYIYEPWHVRYVGKEMAAEIFESGLTLEEYYDAVPVSK